MACELVTIMLTRLGEIKAFNPLGTDRAAQTKQSLTEINYTKLKRLSQAFALR